MFKVAVERRSDGPCLDLNLSLDLSLLREPMCGERLTVIQYDGPGLSNVASRNSIPAWAQRGP